MVASSMSITGMSSLMGYTRLHVTHLSAVPFLTSATGRFALGTGQNFEQFRVDSHRRDYMTPTAICGTIRAMKIAVLLAVLGAATLVEAGQSGRAAAPAAAQPSAVAQAYEQFLLAHRLDDENDQEGAIQAYRRAMALDPTAAEIAASLADLYMRANRNADAIAMAEQALKMAPANREAHRVLGTIYASRLGADNAHARVPASRIWRGRRGISSRPSNGSPAASRPTPTSARCWRASTSPARPTTRRFRFSSSS